MKKNCMLNSVFIALSVSVLLSGCAVKSTDTLGTKTAKHLVNSPLYAVAAVGAVAVGAVGVATTGVMYGTSKLVDKVAGMELYSGETYIGKREEKSLDNNISLAKFYMDNHFSLYKDKDNEKYLYIQKSKDLIQYSNPTFGQRWHVANLENRPYIHIMKYNLPKDTKKEAFLKKINKDKFGNPTYFGDNVFLEIKQRRVGIMFTLLSDIYLIENGAYSVNMYDRKAPKSIDAQIEYYFSDIDT